MAFCASRIAYLLLLNPSHPLKQVRTLQIGGDFLEPLLSVFPTCFWSLVPVSMIWGFESPSRTNDALGSELPGALFMCERQNGKAALGLRPNVGDSSQAAPTMNVVVHAVPRDGGHRKGWS